jgi:cytochrome c peroxidase
VQVGQESFTAEEQHGSDLFFGSAGCSTCHNSIPTNPPANAPQGIQEQVFSNFGYANIGAPANPDNQFYFVDSEFNSAGIDFVDLGLGAIIGSPAQNGKFRMPTLRNVELTSPYMHNGVFTTLEEVVNFYNSRDVDAAIAPPEVSDNLSTRGGIGNLGLSPDDLDDLVSFLRTLTDRPR